MKKMMGALLAAGLSATLVATAGTPATAATNKVTIAKIGTQKVAKGKSATVRPKVRTTGNVVVSSARMDFYRGKKRVAKNLKVATVPVGTYTMKTTVKYKTFTTRTTTTKQTLYKKGDTISPSCTVKRVSHVSAPVSDPLFDALGQVPALGDLLGDLVGTLLGTLIPAYSYEADCTLRGSDPFKVSGFAAGLDLASLSFVTFEGKNPVSSAQVSRGPSDLVGGKFVATDAVAPVDVVKTSKATKRTYSKTKTKKASQKLVVKRK